MPDPHSGVIIPKGVQLHNLREDIGERANLAERHPDVVEALRAVQPLAR